MRLWNVIARGPRLVRLLQCVLQRHPLHRPALQPLVVSFQHALREPIDRAIVRTKEQAEVRAYPLFRLAAEDIGQLDRIRIAAL